MVYCQACGVTSKGLYYGIKFFRFPQNESQRNAWINFINKDKRSNINKNCRLCSQHFEETCFDKTSMLQIRLKPFSVPTIHISRLKYSKYEDTFKKVTTVPSENRETSAINVLDISTDATAMDCNINNQIVEESIPSENCETSAINVLDISIDATAMDCNINKQIVEKSISSENYETSAINTMPSPYSTDYCNYIAATLQCCKLQCNITKTLQRYRSTIY